jgi:hypothetical protein
VKWLPAACKRFSSTPTASSCNGEAYSLLIGFGPTKRTKAFVAEDFSGRPADLVTNRCGSAARTSAVTPLHPTNPGLQPGLSHLALSGRGSVDFTGNTRKANVQAHGKTLSSFGPAISAYSHTSRGQRSGSRKSEPPAALPLLLGLEYAQGSVVIGVGLPILNRGVG